MYGGDGNGTKIQESPILGNRGAGEARLVMHRVAEGSILSKID